MYILYTFSISILCLIYIYIIYLSIYLSIYIHYADFFRLEHYVFVQPTFFFHINDLRGEVNPHAFKMLWKKLSFWYFNKLGQ